MAGPLRAPHCHFSFIDCDKEGAGGVVVMLVVARMFVCPIYLVDTKY